MKIKCIFLLYLFLISTYSNGTQPESDLTKISKQIQLTAEIKKNNRTFGDIKFESFSPAFQVLIWNRKDKNFLDSNLVFKASNTSALRFDIDLTDSKYTCKTKGQIISSPSKTFKAVAQFILDVNAVSREFENNKTATITDTEWQEVNNTHYVDFTVRIIHPKIYSAPGICEGSVTVMFSLLPSPL